MKIIILTAKFGMGHLSVSRALQEEILKKGQNIEVNIVDFYEYLNLNKNAKGNYYDKYLYNIPNFSSIFLESIIGSNWDNISKVGNGAE